METWNGNIFNSFSTILVVLPVKEKKKINIERKNRYFETQYEIYF